MLQNDSRILRWAGICPQKNVIYVQGDEFHCAYSKHKQLKCALKIDASE